MEYFRNGERIRLDTRHLEWVGEHKSDALLRIQEQEKRERDAKRAFTALRIIVSVPLMAFMFCHIDVLYLHTLEVLEALGVIAGGLFVASTIASIFGGE